MTENTTTSATAETSKSRAGSCCAVIVAGGSGERFGDPRGKQFVEICGRPMVAWSIITFDKAPSVGHIVVVCPEHRKEQMRAVMETLDITTPVSFARAGETRQLSCLAGIRAIPAGFDYVAIHDAARPLVTVAAIETPLDVIESDSTLAGAICAHPVVDTIKQVDDEGNVASTPDRSHFWAAQTPQIFHTEAIEDAYEAAGEFDFEGTDDSAVIERMGWSVACVPAARDNMKVTLPEDLIPVSAVLAARLEAEKSEQSVQPEQGK